MLKEKYQSVVSRAQSLKIQQFEAQEVNGRLVLKGTAPFQMEKDMLWDTIKTHDGWEKEISADIKVGSTAHYGSYTIKAGDTLSKLAKMHLGDAKRYMEIFDINKDTLSNPDLVKVGQTVKLPNK